MFIVDKAGRDENFKPSYSSLRNGFMYFKKNNFLTVTMNDHDEETHKVLYVIF
jgi:hypothetical protein